MKPGQLYHFLVRLLAIVFTMVLTIGIFFPMGTVKAASNVYGLPFPISDDQAHITDGIIVWGIIIVAIIFIGKIMGSRGRRKKQPNKPKHD
jgi:hypothetical protein